MSKAARLREQSARERIAAQQAAAKRKEARRRLIILGSSIFVVLAIVVGLVVAYGVRSTPKGTAAANSVTRARREAASTEYRCSPQVGLDNSRRVAPTPQSCSGMRAVPGLPLDSDSLKSPRYYSPGSLPS